MPRPPRLHPLWIAAALALPAPGLARQDLVAVEPQVGRGLLDQTVWLARNHEGSGRGADVERLSAATQREQQEIPDRIGEVDGDGEESIRLDYKPVVVTRYQPMERKY